MLAGACWGVYPVLLPATTGTASDVTLARALSGPHTLAVTYVVFVYSRFKGKADAAAQSH